MDGMKNNCVFCAIAAGEIPSFKVYEDDVALAYLDINPFSKGHVLVIPKEHSEGLLDTPDETLAAVVSRVKKIAAHVKETLPCDGFNILQNNGEAAGQSVFHLHMHLIPRYQDAENNGRLLGFSLAGLSEDEIKGICEALK